MRHARVARIHSEAKSSSCQRQDVSIQQHGEIACNFDLASTLWNMIVFDHSIVQRDVESSNAYTVNL